MKLNMIAGALLIAAFSLGASNDASAQCGNGGPRFSVGLSFGGGYGGGGYATNYCPPPPPPPPPPPVYYAPAPVYYAPVSYGAYRGYGGGYHRGRGRACGQRRGYGGGGYCR